MDGVPGRRQREKEKIFVNHAVNGFPYGFVLALLYLNFCIMLTGALQALCIQVSRQQQPQFNSFNLCRRQHKSGSSSNYQRLFCKLPTQRRSPAFISPHSFQPVTITRITKNSFQIIFVWLLSKAKTLRKDCRLCYFDSQNVQRP